MVAVFPGTQLTLARFFRLNILLIADDFPTLERPANAISTPFDGGICFEIPYEILNSALLKFIRVLLNLYQLVCNSRRCHFTDWLTPNIQIIIAIFILFH